MVGADDLVDGHVLLRLQRAQAHLGGSDVADLHLGLIDIAVPPVNSGGGLLQSRSVVEQADRKKHGGQVKQLSINETCSQVIHHCYHGRTN